MSSSSMRVLGVVQSVERGIRPGLTLKDALALGASWLSHTEQAAAALVDSRWSSQVLEALRSINLEIDPGIADGQARLFYSHSAGGAATLQDAHRVEVLAKSAGLQLRRRLLPLVNGLYIWELANEIQPSLAAAVARYRSGCPQHHSVRCEADGCQWLPVGRSLVSWS